MSLQNSLTEVFWTKLKLLLASIQLQCLKNSEQSFKIFDSRLKDFYGMPHSFGQCPLLSIEGFENLVSYLQGVWCKPIQTTDQCNFSSSTKQCLCSLAGNCLKVFMIAQRSDWHNQGKADHLSHDSVHCLLTHNFRQETSLRHGKFSTSALFNFIFIFFFIFGSGFSGRRKGLSCRLGNSEQFARGVGR